MSDRPLSEWGTRGPPWRAAAPDARPQLSPIASLEAQFIGGIDRRTEGELPGVRATMDEIIRQEIAGGCRPETARAQVLKIALDYDRDVSRGRDRYPLRRD